MASTDPHSTYEAPVITDLGSLAELTQGGLIGIENGLDGQGGDIGDGFTVAAS